MKENAERKSYELPHGFSLWQKKGWLMFGALAKFLSKKPGLKPGVVLRFFVVIPPAEAGGNSTARVRGRALAALVMKGTRASGRRELISRESVEY